jgi:hypothetical protein
LRFRAATCVALVFFSAASIAFAEAFKLKDGSLIFGEQISRSDSGLVIRTKHLGDIRVDPGSLACTGTEALGQAYCSDERITEDPEGEALFLVPTAFTPPKNSGSFRDAELLLLNVGFAPTASTSLTGGFLFPVTSEMQMLTGAIKQRLFLSDSGNAALAVSGSITKPYGDFSTKTRLRYEAAAIFSLRSRTTVGNFQDGVGLHAALGYVWEKQRGEYLGYPSRYASDLWRNQVSFGCGAEIRLTRHVKLIGEFTNVQPLFFDSDEIKGLINFGLRLHGAKLAADLAGIRPVTDEDLGNFFAFPLITISYRIGN